jgi:S1-C subfamily serine protease
MRPVKTFIEHDDLWRALPPHLDPRCVLALAAETADGLFPSGSAVLISDRLAITARHVIDDYLARFGMTPAGTYAFNIVGACAFSRDDWSVKWTFRTTATAEGSDEMKTPTSDLTLLALPPAGPPIKGIRCPTLRLVPPGSGEKVVNLGCHSSNVRRTVTGENVLDEWRDERTISTGVIHEVFHQRRDSSMMPFPCFVSDAFSANGMSGGPVFDLEARLCGVLSTGVADAESGEHASTLSSVWPALVIPIEADLVGSEMTSPCFLYDAVLRGLVKADGLERFQVSYHSPGITISLLAR